MKEIFKKYGHGIFALYLFIYLPWFFALEGLTDVDYHVMHCVLDDYIPFCEFFIIPYTTWFFYMFFTCIFMFFKSKRGDFYRFAITLTGGMSIAMFICMLYPSCTNLRPEYIEGTGILAKLIAVLYTIDTSTNVFPSIHVLDSIIACVALERNEYIRKHLSFRIINIFVCVMICLSTVFIKQHSALDVIGAAVLYVILYCIIYLPKYKWFNDERILIP